MQGIFIIKRRLKAFQTDGSSFEVSNLFNRTSLRTAAVAPEMQERLDKAVDETEGDEPSHSMLLYATDAGSVCNGRFAFGKGILANGLVGVREML